jgi:site-specific DNA recombinase
MAVARAIRTTRPRAAAIYCRISDDRTGEAAGVARQQQDCRALAQRKGWPVADLYIDNDLSASGRKPRPAYARMLEDIRSGAVDAVIVWHLDRLHRSPKELETFFEVCDAAGVQHLATCTGDVDLATDDGRFNARIQGAVARKESDDKSRRILRKHEQLAASGKLSGGGTRPFGYEENRLAVRIEEARLVREAARRVLAGDSLRSVVRDWNKRKVRTSGGRPWYTSAIHRLLTSARIAGQREHHGEVVAKAEWPAIITPADSARLRAFLNDPARRLNRGARRYLLTGFIRCALCGQRLHARPRGDKRRCYVCASGPGFDGCGKIRVLSEPLEEMVASMVAEAVDTPRLAAAIARERRVLNGEKDLVRSVSGDEEQLEQLARDWAEKRITRPEWLAARSSIEHRLETTRTRLSRERRTLALDGYVGRPGALSRAWETLDLDKRRAVIGEIVDRVEVGAAVKGRNRFDPDRVRVMWRF